MNLIKQKYRWSCLTASFAMALGVSEDDLMNVIGHQGDEVIWPDLQEPYMRRSFHISELVIASLKLGYSASPVDALPVSEIKPSLKINHVKDKINRAIGSGSIAMSELLIIKHHLDSIGSDIYPVPIFDFHDIIKNNSGVLIGETLGGRPHAVAWNGNLCYDPTGPITYNVMEFLIETFYIVKKVR